jgi:hypothetical protein
MPPVPHRKRTKTVARSPVFVGILSLFLLTAAAALALSACGGEGAAAEKDTSAARTTAQPSGRGGAATASGCPAKVHTLREDLGRLRRQLAVGLSYDQYAARVEQLNVVYAAIPVEHLTIGCLRTTATPAERALNRYIDGTNAWGECLADAGCSTATIEPVLQRKWRAASHFLSEAQ